MNIRREHIYVSFTIEVMSTKSKFDWPATVISTNNDDGSFVRWFPVDSTRRKCNNAELNQLIYVLCIKFEMPSS